MLSLFSAFGLALEPLPNQLPEQLPRFVPLAADEGRCAAPLAQCGLQPGGAACSQVGAGKGTLKRRAYLKAPLENFGQEASAYRDTKQGIQRYWARNFLFEKFGPMGKRELAERSLELRAAMLEVAKMRHRAGLNPMHYDKRGQKSASNKTVQPCKRKRAPFERGRLCEDLDDEVWGWFVDRLATNKTRVSTDELLRVAEEYGC